MKLKNQAVIFKDKEIKGRIVEGLNLSHLTKIQQDKILSILLGNVSFKLSILIESRLSKEEQEELKIILSKSGTKKVLNYVNSKVKNLPELIESIIRKTMNDFRRIRAKL